MIDPPAPHPHAPLRGLRVLEWGTLTAAPYAARLLADAGAEVAKVEPPGGDLARLEGPFPGDRPDAERSGLFAYLNRGKRSLVLDATTADGRRTLRRLGEAADIFIHDQPALPASPLGCSAGELLSANPRLIVVSVTPFGEHGPRAAHCADDLILVSASGLAFATPGFPDHVSDPEAEPPLRANANLGEVLGGLMAAVGAVFALLGRERTGVGDAVEVSKQEALASMLVRELGLYTYGRVIIGRHPQHTVRAPNHYLPVADGWAAIVAFLDAHWQALVDVMGSPEWASDPRFGTGISRGEHWKDLEPLLLSWMLQQPGRVLLERTQGRGIPCAPALSLREAVESVQVAARQFLVPSGLAGDARGRLPGDVYVIDAQRRLTNVRAPTLGADTAAVCGAWLAAGDGPRVPEFHRGQPSALSPQHSVLSTQPGRQPSADNSQLTTNSAARLPLAGVRVIDFGQIVAMPMVGQWLAFLGAEVILVETRAHLPSRGFAPFAGEPSLETSAVFNHVNRAKRSCTLNVRTPEGLALAKRLIATADVVLENFSPGTMDKLGLGYEDLRAVKPDLIMVSLSACGSTGPWRSFSALHSGVIALSGMAAVTGYEEGHPRLVGALLPDPTAAAYCALGLLQALYYRQRTGAGQHVEVAMTETLQSLLPEAILEYTMLEREAPRVGNRHPWKAPHGIYRARGDDRWLAISVSTEAEWQALCQVMGQPELAGDPRFGDAAGRRAHAAALDPLITAWSRGLRPEEAAERLQQAGVAASLVYDARDVLGDPHLQARGFIHEDRHPSAGAHPMPAAPWRFRALPPLVYGHAPLLGADNDYVFGGLLGLAEAEMRRLEAARVIY